MRMIYNVIDQMLACIPKDQQKVYGDLIVGLVQLREDTLYKAPEQMPQYFQAAANLLNAHLGEPDAEWKKKIQRIFADKEPVTGWQRTIADEDCPKCGFPETSREVNFDHATTPYNNRSWQCSSRKCPWKFMTKHDLGRWVEYRGAAGEIELGRLKSYDNVEQRAWVVYKANGEWQRFRRYTGQATSYADLVFVAVDVPPT